MASALIVLVTVAELLAVAGLQAWPWPAITVLLCCGMAAILMLMRSRRRAQRREASPRVAVVQPRPAHRAFPGRTS